MMISEYLNESAKELVDRLYTTEYDPVSLQKDLEAGRYDTETINAAALEYVDECASLLQYEMKDYESVTPGETVPGFASSHLTNALELLLQYGLDPNWIFREKNGDDIVDEYNIMEELQLVDNGYQGADGLYLLLSHGGNPNLVVNGIPLLAEPHFNLGFDTCNRDMLYDAVYAAKVHYCMVLIGFGAKCGDKEDQLDRVNNFDLSLLRNHRDYYVGAIHSDKSDDGMELCFFDKHTNWEVARY